MLQKFGSKYRKSLIAGVAVVSSTLTSSVYAAGGAVASTSILTVVKDVTLVGGSLVTVAATIYGFMVIKGMVHR